MKPLRFLCFLLFAFACAADPPAPKASPPDGKAPARPRRARTAETLRAESLVYKTTAEKPLHLYVYKPADWKASDHRPAFVFIHGGGWAKGNWRAADPWAEALCRQGMVVFSVEYRLTEQGPKLDPSPCIEDAKSALRHIRSHAAELGLDPSRVAAAGNSAGGHLATACALLPGFESEAESRAVSCRPDALVLLEPVLDNGPEGGYQFDAPIIKADYARFSPAHHVAEGAPPTVIFGGRSDRAAKLDFLKRFDAAMRQQGNDCALHEYDGPHGFCNEPLVLQDIQRKAVAFFTRLGWLTAESKVFETAQVKVPDSKMPSPVIAKHGPSGVWLQVNHNQTFDNDLPSLSHYRGVMIGRAWSEIERSEGAFDWKSLDATLEQAADLGLYVGVGIASGPQSPEWLYDHGVPKVMTEGHARGGPYPYYLDSHYEFYHGRLLAEFGRHVRSLPARLTDRLTCVLVMTGSTQDEAPYKGTPTPAKYAITDAEWLKFRLSAFAKYNAAFQEGPDPVIPLLFNGLMSWSDGGPEAHAWVRTHVKGGWAHKASIGHFYQLNGEAARMKEYLPPVIDRPADSDEFAFTRCEMDVTWQKPIFRANIGMNFYWTALSALHNGLGTWHLTSSARDWCRENSAWESIELFNRYAGQNRSATATGAFCALREGLNAADTRKFPEDKFGKADMKNKDRYLAICQAHASRGARMDSVDAVLGGQANQRNTQKGLNDAGWDIIDGNYERFLHQIDAETTSVGWWRVGGEVTPSTPMFARFARGFEHASGKDAMHFDLKDSLFHGLPLDGASPVSVRVVYYDKGTGRWALQYDAVGNAQKTAYEVTKTDSGTWKDKTVTLPDAQFGNRGPHGADLMLTNSDAEDDSFHLIEITRPAPRS